MITRISRSRQRLLRTALRLALVPLTFGGAIACHELVDPPLPNGAEPFAAPAQFELWWAMTEACANRSAPMSSIAWYVVPGTRTINDGGKVVSGYWSEASNRIVLAEEAAQLGPVVRHEMLHALLHGGGHPRQAFLENCGGIVSCGPDCLAEAGPAPAAPAGAIVVPPESLRVSVSVFPSLPTRAVFGGHFTLTVLASNPMHNSVVVALPALPDGASLGFRFDVGGSSRELSYDDFVQDASVWRFAPGETKRHVFDLVVGEPGEAWALWPGTHRVEGGYGLKWSPPVALDINP